jgi:hypothetical protein
MLSNYNYKDFVSLFAELIFLSTISVLDSCNNHMRLCCEICRDCRVRLTDCRSLLVSLMTLIYSRHVIVNIAYLSLVRSGPRELHIGLQPTSRDSVQALCKDLCWEDDNIFLGPPC